VAYAPTDGGVVMKLGPGISFSWKRAIGISALRNKVARATGIPTTRGGIERKIGRAVTRGLFSLLRKR
jgi:hypothetical protein